MREKIEKIEKYKSELETHLKKFKGNKAVKASNSELILEEKESGKHEILKKQFHSDKDKA